MGFHIMSKIVATLVILCGISRIEAATCEWIGGASGSQIQCLLGWFPTGPCGSSNRASCKDGLSGSKYYYMLYCCNSKNVNEPSGGTYQIGFSAGVDQACDASADGSTTDVMIGGCGSGGKNDCDLGGTKYTNIITCGVTSSVSFGPVSSCSWR